MSLQAFVWAVRTLTIVVLGAFGLLVYFLDPDVVGVYGSILFYFLGGLLLFGVIYLAVLGMYRMLFGDEKAVHAIGASARQAALLLFGGIVTVVLVRKALWYWWSILLLLALLLLLEISLRRPGKRHISES